jgi:hypothetical protein
MMGNQRHLRKALLAIWLIFICKGVFYSLLTPLWDGFDEYAHFSFIQYVALHHELPLPDTRVSREIDRSLELAPLASTVVSTLGSHTDHDAYWKLAPQDRAARQTDLLKIPSDAQYEQGENSLYEGKQAPLYYWLMTPFYQLARTTNLPNRVFLFRIINVCLASLVIPIAFLTSRQIFATDRAGLFVCLLIAAMPELYIDTSRVGNQSLAMILFGIFAFSSFRIAHDDIAYLPIAGITVGLLLLTKAYGLAAVPPLAVLAALTVITAPEARRPRALIASAGALVGAIVIPTWWYLRNVQLVGAIIWADGAPEKKMTLSEILRHVPRVNWSRAANSFVGSHLWFGNWSSLTVRSWMYDVFQFVALIAAGGLVLLVIRGMRRQPPEKPVLVARRDLFVCLSIYGTFLAASAYHVLMNSINIPIDATPGWYLYAVVIPEAILVVAGLLAFKWGKEMVTATVVFFFALEMYATHFVLIPYYSGLIWHAPDGGLRSFHVSQLNQIGLAELLARLEINRPVFATNVVLLTAWCVFLIASTLLVYFAVKWAVRAVQIS